MKDEDMDQFEKEWQQQPELQQAIDLFLRQGLRTMLNENRPTQYQRRRRGQWRTLLFSLLLLLLCCAAALLSFLHGLVGCGLVAAAAGLPCLWAAAVAGYYLHLLRHVHPVKCSYVEVRRNNARILRLEALRRLRRRRLSSLLRLPAAPSPRTLRWVGAAGAACLLLVVALCLWQLPQPVAPAPRAAQQLASTSAPQPAQPAAPATSPVAPAAASVAAERQVPSLTSAPARHSGVRRAAAMSASEPAQIAEAVPMEAAATVEHYGELLCSGIVRCDTTYILCSIESSFSRFSGKRGLS